MSDAPMSAATTTAATTSAATMSAATMSAALMSAATSAAMMTAATTSAATMTSAVTSADDRSTWRAAAQHGAGPGGGSVARADASGACSKAETGSTATRQQLAFRPCSTPTVVPCEVRALWTNCYLLASRVSLSRGLILLPASSGETGIQCTHA